MADHSSLRFSPPGPHSMDNEQAPTGRLFQPKGDEVMTRALVLAAILVAGAMLLPHGSAHARGWCAEYDFGEGGATNCGLSTYEQCRATISGIGGACRPG
jgi:Protein of unknown function (DUF3551)